MSMHFDPGSSTSIFVASSILLQAKLILQWTVCLKIWCVWLHGEHLHLANSQADRRETIFHSQHAGAHFLTPGCTSKLFTTWLPEKSKMHFGRVTGQAKPQAKQVQTHHVWSYPIFWLPGFFWLFLFVTSHRAIFVIVDGMRFRLLPRSKFFTESNDRLWVLGAELLDEIAKGRQLMYMIQADIHQPIW